MGSPRVFALLGDPVQHSLSPVMHNAAFAATAVDAVYVARRCAAADVARSMRELAGAGGGGNVTVPHKGVAFAALDRALPAARATDACNTFWLEDGLLTGDNTDVAGFAAAVRALTSEIPSRALVLGAGGAARAATYWLAGAGATVDIAGRSPERVAGLVARLAGGGGGAGQPALGEIRTAPWPPAQPPERRDPGPPEKGGDEEGAWDLVVNATPLGLHPQDPAPLDLASAGSVGAVLDMTYGPLPSALGRAADALGIPWTDGREMLLHQAAAAFALWSGREAPLRVMREALFAA